MICTAIETCYRKLISLVSGEWIFGYLREPFCYMPCYWLTTLLFSFHSWTKTGVGISFVYTFLYWARLFLLGLHPLIESSPSECFELCHGHGLWIRIIVKVVCNHCWEIYVDNCRLSFIRFSRMYIVVKILFTLDDTSWFPNTVESRYSDIPVIVCTIELGCDGFPSTGCILPILCLSTWSWLAFTDSEGFFLSFLCCLQEAESCYVVLLLPVLFWTRSWVVFVGIPPLFRAHLLQDYRILWYVCSQ